MCSNVLSITTDACCPVIIHMECSVIMVDFPRAALRGPSAFAEILVNRILCMF